MNAEKLISMAAARGIDPIALAKQATHSTPRPDTAEHIHCGHRFVTLLEAPQRRAYGKSSRTMAVDQDWTSADVGHALAGLGRAQTLAALYAWAGASANYWPLVIELRQVATRMRGIERWPAAVMSHRGEPIEYIERLCEMVLFDDGHPGILDLAPTPGIGQDDQVGILRAICCEVTLPVWRAHLEGCYTRIYGIWIGWLDEAVRRTQAKLRDDDEDDA